MNNERVVRRLKINNWVILILLTALSGGIWGPKFSVSVLCGGLVIIVNFNALYRALGNAFQRSLSASTATFVLKYYLRLTATGFILLFLMFFFKLSPIALVLGLSTVTLNLMLFAAFETYKLLSKEANV